MADGTDAAWLSFSTDMNADGKLTLADVWLWLVQAFFTPGDALLWVMLSYTPWLAQFLELSSHSYGGVFAAIVSATVWLFGLLTVAAVCTLILDFDRALTGRVARYYGEWQRRGRVVRTWLVCQTPRIRNALSMRAREPNPEIDLDEFKLDELEMEVLRSHAFLAPGYVLGVRDLVSSLEIRTAQGQQLLNKLEKLALLQRGFGSSEGETGYRLSPLGQVVLMAHSRIARG